MNVTLLLAFASMAGACGGAMLGVGIAYGTICGKLEEHDKRLDRQHNWIERIDTRIVELERRKQ